MRVFHVDDSLEATRLFLGFAGFRRLVVFVFAVIPESPQTPGEISSGNLFIILLFVLVGILWDLFHGSLRLLFG